jgi:hypothetical protein
MEENFSTSGKYYQIFVIFAVIYHTQYLITILFVLFVKVVVYSGKVLLTTAEGITLLYLLRLSSASQ